MKTGRLKPGDRYDEAVVKTPSTLQFIYLFIFCFFFSTRALLFGPFLIRVQLLINEDSSKIFLFLSFLTLVFLLLLLAKNKFISS